MPAGKGSGWWNIITGAVLLLMGLSGLFGGSIFTGDASIIDAGFDFLGIGLIIWGIVQLTRKS